MNESPRLPEDPPAAPNAPETDSEQVAQHPVEADELLEMLGDEYTYDVFKAVVEEPRTGRELIKATDASKPTVYRRLGDLKEAGLVETTMQIASDGNHCKRFHAVVSSLKVCFDADGFSARLNADRCLSVSGASATGTQPPADD